jgi:hypothetical protein
LSEIEKHEGSSVVELIREEERRLAALKERINEEHRQCEEAVGTALEHAINAGEGLTEMKRWVSHGRWGAWLRDNFEGSERTAQAYMRLHRRRDEIRNGAADLSIRGALSSLSAPKPKALPEADAPTGTSGDKGVISSRFAEWTAQSAPPPGEVAGVQRADDSGEKSFAEMYVEREEARREAKAAERGVGPHVIVRLVRAGAMEYFVEYGDGLRHTVIRPVLLNQGWKKCDCCGGYGIVEK